MDDFYSQIKKIREENTNKFLREELSRIKTIILNQTRINNSRTIYINIPTESANFISDTLYLDFLKRELDGFDVSMSAYKVTIVFRDK